MRFLLLSMATALTLGAGFAPASAAPSPCSHLTASQAAKATGLPFTSATVNPKVRADQEGCSYHTAAFGPLMVIAIMPLAGPEIMASEDNNMSMMLHLKLVKLSGIGDEAYLLDDKIDVRKGNVQYHFTLNSQESKATEISRLTKAARATNY